jgi:hypothetical protein
VRLHLATSGASQPDFLDLPFDQPLDDWPDELVIDIPKGVHRHPVRFIPSGDALFALKELPGKLAHHEWRLLRHLDDENIPVVEAVGVVDERDGDLDDVLITRHLEYSMPFRHMFARNQLPHFREALVDAIAVLIVRLHLGGFFWGDCSLSNTLFLRDAGALSAYVVDVETAELHDRLSDGQRVHDLDIMQVNVLGGLSDLEAQQGLPEGLDPVDIAESLRSRYEALWTELTSQDVVPAGERWRIDDRLRRLNELGFDTGEIEMLSDHDGVRFRPVVVEAGHHRRQLQRLTGIEAQENQARRLLNDMASWRAFVEQSDGVHLPDGVAAYRWLSEVFEPALAAIPAELTDRRDRAELFHEVLAHRDHLRESEGRDMRVPAAAAEFVANVLPSEAQERTVLPTEDD